MKCPGEYEWELYLDKELPPARIDQLDTHLAGCPDCRHLVDGLRREWVFIAEALAETPLPPDLIEIIKRRMDTAGRHNARWIWLSIPAVILTGVLFTSVSGWWSLAEKLLGFIKLLGGAGLLPDLLVFAAVTLREIAQASLRGSTFVPALALLALCLSWIKLSLRKGGPAHV